jgi:hypothetical protein
MRRSAQLSPKTEIGPQIPQIDTDFEGWV